MKSSQLLTTLVCSFTLGFSTLSSSPPVPGACCATGDDEPTTPSKACGQDGSCESGGSCSGACSLDLNVGSATLKLSPEARQKLVDQLAEETLAAEVYRTLGKSYDLHPFQNIPRAEDQHARAMRELLSAAGVNLAEVEPNPDFIALKQDLIAQGKQSEIEALKVGAFIEERDIADLRELAEHIDDTKALMVIRQLETGSHHHLNAFVRNLKMRGASYEPVVLSPADFAAILN